MPASTLAANPWPAGRSHRQPAPRPATAWPRLAFPPLAPGRPAVFVLPLDTVDDAWLAQAAAILSDEERARLSCFAFLRDARQYAAARVLLRLALGHYLDCAPGNVVLYRDEAGKPHVGAAADVDVSISHCDGCVAVAIVRGGRVGIDVERLDRAPADYLALAQRFYAEPEYRALRLEGAGGGFVRFIELWTLKEAYVKALGLGLGKSLDECVFTFDTGTGLRFRDRADSAGEGDDWHFQLYDTLSSYRLGIAAHAAGTAAGAAVLAVDFARGIGPCDARLLRSNGACG